jgi:hypothetical protein
MRIASAPSLETGIHSIEKAQKVLSETALPDEAAKTRLKTIGKEG